MYLQDVVTIMKNTTSNCYRNMMCQEDDSTVQLQVDKKFEDRDWSKVSNKAVLCKDCRKKGSEEDNIFLITFSIIDEYDFTKILYTKWQDFSVWYPD